MPHGFVNMRIFIVEENSEKSSVSRLEIFILIKRGAVLEEATGFYLSSMYKVGMLI